MELIQINHIPEGFLEVTPKDLHQVLSGPTLIHLSGAKKRPLLMSVLLHGNEYSGFLAAQQLLKSTIGKNKELPRDLSILVGNVEAAKEKKRFLSHQLDFNRIWTDQGTHPQEKWAHQVFLEMQKRDIFAAIDVHNNTGKNPYYSCLNRLDLKSIQLASMFETDILYFTNPKDVFSNFFSRLCPAITLESGLSEDPLGVAKVVKLTKEILKLETVTDFKGDLLDRKIYRSFGKVKIPQGSKISFGKNSDKADFNFSDDIEELNFHRLKKGDLFGMFFDSCKPLEIYDNSGQLVEESLFDYENNQIFANKEFVPAMLTKETKIINQDCLCYLLEEITLDSLS